MKAVQIDEYGGIDKLIVRDIPKPALAPGKILVKVASASLNPFDIKLRNGDYKDSIKLVLPITLGGDFAGVIEEVSDPSFGLKVGDKVYGQASAVSGNSGAFAEYLTTTPDQVAKMPYNIFFPQAAAIPLTGVSAIQAITEHIDLQPGETILIHGGSGGIGSIAIQIAKHIGANVITTVPSGSLEYAKTLGADQAIDYELHDFRQMVSGCDAVFDTAGGDTLINSLSVLKKGGRAVSMTSSVAPEEAAKFGVTAITQQTKVTRERLDKLTGLIEKEVIRVQIDKTYPIDRVARAFEQKESSNVKGKIAITIARL